MSPRLPLLCIVAAGLLAGCDRRPDEGPVVVSAIGGEPALANPNRGDLSTPERILLGATAQGLVRFDAAGQIEPGIAERWTVIDEGKSYIFRLADAEWPDGSPVTAQDVVTALTRTVRSESNPLHPYLTAIDEIVEMTPEVIEIRLSAPRPDLLSLFAQPELAIFRARGLAGSGPLRVIDEGDGDGVLLRPLVDAQAIEADEVEPPTPEDHVRLHGERAALAVARFAERRSDLVTGGSFRDWPVVEAPGLAPDSIRIDPANGLFGLAIVSREGFLADPGNRAAIAMAIDRAALTAAFRPDWEPVDTVLPGQFDSATPPVAPGWASLDLQTRRLAARARVTIWLAGNPETQPLRVAMPGGPGARIVWAFLQDAIRGIGLDARRVDADADADLRLIDQVAPYDSGRWYLSRACRPCSAEAAALIEQARTAEALIDRRLAIARADAALATDTAYIPIARPLRWSLVSARLQRFQINARAWHPLTRLRGDPN